MQAVPSLVGCGTAVAAAATGLVFGEPATTTRRAPPATAASPDQAPDPSPSPATLPPARPATSAAPAIGSELPSHLHPSSPRRPLSRRQRPQSSQLAPPRQSFALARHGQLSLSAAAGRLAAPPAASPGGSGRVLGARGARESVSSSGSWIKRLSVRPLSHHDSPRSSTFSLSSAAPILPRPSSATPSLPPNKLVKRSLSRRSDDPGDSPRRRPRGHLPTLRRPATSHQRSATLQQFRADVDLAHSAAHPKYSFDRPIRAEELLGASPLQRPPEPPPNRAAARSGWTSFFHSRRTTSIIASASVPSRLGNASSPARISTIVKSICPEGDQQQRRVHLVKPRMLSPSPLFPSAAQVPEGEPARRPTDVGQTGGSPESATAITRTRRSLSASFSSAGHWVSKTSGSLRRPKRGADQSSECEGTRHVSDPASGSPPTAADRQHEGSRVPQRSTGSPVATVTQGLNIATTIHPHHQHQQRQHQHQYHQRSPVSPPPRPLSSPVVAVARYPGVRPNQPSGSSTSSSVAVSQLVGRSHSSAMESSDGDCRGFTSGDDDDTDFKSDTAYDSVRTLASGRVRAVETPLESVYDESPPSTAGNGKTNKRLPIHEVLEPRGWDGDDKITEEDDDDTTTPVRAARLPRRDVLAEASQNAAAHSAQDLDRLSLDGSEEDWTRDDDVPLSPLSPPSKGSSLSPRVAINPNVRLALSRIGESQGESAPPTTGGGCALGSERSRSNLFDWSELPVHDRHNGGGDFLRPRTAYGKPEMDSRGGRSATRKGPMPAHVRSQSVPVVHDPADDSKPSNSKYGTWGMGSKTVSEDWDEDFEFGSSGGSGSGGAGAGDNAGSDNDANGSGAGAGSSGNAGAGGRGSQATFAVPESIRATQPSVKAHSGQIRELSLLVNDLKRLCRHGRELKMLDGEHRGLWREAEGIIALASPDEDDVGEGQRSASSANLDGASDAAANDGEPAMSRTAVVRERQSPRRRSVFSPEDDIFGGSWPQPAADEGAPPARASRPRTPDSRAGKPGDVSRAVRSVVESMHQQRQHADRDGAPTTAGGPANNPNDNHNNRVHFDTNSLKALVRRAGELRDGLSELVRRADQIAPSPAATPRRLDSSPAFTRVFDDPGLMRSRSANSVAESPPSPDKSPSSPMGRHLAMMTVG